MEATSYVRRNFTRARPNSTTSLEKIDSGFLLELSMIACQQNNHPTANACVVAVQACHVYSTCSLKEKKNSPGCHLLDCVAWVRIGLFPAGACSYREYGMGVPLGTLRGNTVHHSRYIGRQFRHFSGDGWETAEHMTRWYAVTNSSLFSCMSRRRLDPRCT
jgi:hypothetical protein